MSQHVRADIILRQWGRWSRLGLAKIGYPTKPAWQSHISEYIYLDDSLMEECNRIVSKAKPQHRAIIIAYYSVIYPIIKDKRKLTLATRIYMRQNSDYKPTSQRINAVIDHIKYLVSKNIL